MSMSALRRRRIVQASAVSEPSIAIATSFTYMLVMQGGTATRTITLTRTSYTGAVSLAVAGLPSGVTGAFSSPTLSGDTLTSELTLTADGDAPEVILDAFAITASGTGVANSVINYAVTVATPSSFDGPAELPGARLADFKAWANPIPNWSAIISAGRSVTVAGSTQSDLQSAINTAAAMTGGDRLVIVPNNFSARVEITAAVNADTNHSIIVAWSKIVDGTYSIARGTRIPKTAPAGMPLLETVDAGADQGTILTFGYDNPAHCKYKMYGLNIRIASAAAGNSYSYALINYGIDARPADPASSPSYLLLSHCIVGGRRFDGSGNWRRGNLGRSVVDGGRGFAMLDSYDVEHGSEFIGSDRGIWGGWFSQGPVWFRNVATDFGGGIPWMHGGADTPASYPNCEDVEIEYCWFARDEAYNPHSADKVLDASSAACPWALKNSFEIKTGGRVNIHHSVFSGDRYGVAGQAFAVAFKSNNQDGTGRIDSTYDIVFASNLVFSGDGGIALIGAECFTTGGTINGLARFTLRDNIVISGLNATYSSGGAVPNTLLQISPANVTTDAFLGTMSRNWLVQNNYWEVSTESIAGLASEVYLIPNTYPAIDTSFVYRRNVTGSLSGWTVDGGGYSDYGMNGVLNPVHYGASTVRTCEDNVRIGSGGSQPASDNNHPNNIYSLNDKAALGISDGGRIGERVQAGDSALLTAGMGGIRVGPDFTELNSMRTSVEAGTL